MFYVFVHIIKEISIEFLLFVNKVEATLKSNSVTSSQHAHVMFWNGKRLLHIAIATFILDYCLAACSGFALIAFVYF